MFGFLVVFASRQVSRQRGLGIYDLFPALCSPKLSPPYRALPRKNIACAASHCTAIAWSTLFSAITPFSDRAFLPASLLSLSSLLVLSPLLSLLFGESRRRRRAATLLLQERGSGGLARARLAWAFRRAGGRRSILAASATTAKLFMQDAAAKALSLPARLAFRAVVGGARLVKAVRRAAPVGTAAPSAA